MPNVTLNKVSNKKIFSRLTNTYNIIERKHHKKSKSAFAYPMSLLP